MCSVEDLMNRLQNHPTEALIKRVEKSCPELRLHGGVESKARSSHEKFLSIAAFNPTIRMYFSWLRGLPLQCTILFCKAHVSFLVRPMFYLPSCSCLRCVMRDDANWRLSRRVLLLADSNLFADVESLRAY